VLETLIELLQLYSVAFAIVIMSYAGWNVGTAPKSPFCCSILFLMLLNFISLFWDVM